MPGYIKKVIFTVSLVTFGTLAGTHASLADAEDPDRWTQIKSDLFEQQPIREQQGEVQFFVPRQVENAALMPVSIRISSQLKPHLEQLYLIVDRNPVPLAANFHFSDTFRQSPDAGELEIATRIRVDGFSNVRVVARDSNGNLIMSSRFVSASGGCSSPPSTDMATVMNGLGSIKSRLIENSDLGENWRQLDLRVKHPNFTGMQMHPEKPRELIPEYYINQVSIDRDSQTFVRIDTGISIAENPSFRISFGDGEAANYQVTLTDTENNSYAATIN